MDQALVIIRGQKVLRVKKMDYTRHSEAKKLVPEKTSCHVPEWRRNEEAENGGSGAEAGDGGFLYRFEPGEWPGTEDEKTAKEEQTAEAGKTTEITETGETGETARTGWAAKREKPSKEDHEADTGEPGKIERMEDLFTDDW